MAECVCEVEKKVCEHFDEMLATVLKQEEFDNKEEMFKELGFNLTSFYVMDEFYHYRFNLEDSHKDFVNHFDYVRDAVSNSPIKGIISNDNDGLISINDINIDEFIDDYDYSLNGDIYDSLAHTKIDELLQDEFDKLGIDSEIYKNYNSQQEDLQTMTYKNKKYIEEYNGKTRRELQEGMGKSKLNELNELIQDFKKAADEAVNAYTDICWFFDMTSHTLQLNDNCSHIKSTLDLAYKSLQQIYDFENANEDTTTTLSSSVKDWYMKEYPDDDLGEDIDDDITFSGVYNVLKKGEDVYDYLADDSVVRERVFDKLADLKGCDYDDIYEMWLHGDEN